MRKNNYSFTLPTEESAEEFIKKINKYMDTKVFTYHPFIGQQAKIDEKTVIVPGTDSFSFDLKLLESCKKSYNEVMEELVN